MNKKDVRRFILLTSLTLILTIILTITISFIYYKKIEKNNNLILSTIIYNMKKEYPELNDEEIIHLLNTEKLKEYPELEQYGILVKKNNVSLSNKHILNNCLLSISAVLIAYLVLNCAIIMLFNKKREENLREITSYLKAINNQQYDLEIKANEEGEYSILQNELYKTTIMLNEQAALNKKDKESLKDSLSDISHQLRTPLTSINLMIDNLREGNLSKEEENKLLSNINRKIKSTNFLIESLLKLSKFDANTITFNNTNQKIDKILKSVEENVQDLLDLNEVELHIKGNKTDTLYCDYKWQIEALTNIVKNCIEHSSSGTSIDIEYSKSELLTKITIKDHGCGMNKNDQKHIFDRFYKGEHSNPNSIGIGMSLAKSIIEKNNGTIHVNSKEGEGSEFVIKYFN
jgi:signal transduction histidine kinase